MFSHKRRVNKAKQTWSSIFRYDFGENNTDIIARYSTELLTTETRRVTIVILHYVRD